MSFSNLKSKRQFKSSKSYVHASSGPTTTTPTHSTTQTPVQHDSGLLSTPAGLYKDLPAALEIRKSSDSGRGLWVREATLKGSVLLSVEPHSFVLSNHYLDSRCSACVGAAASSGLKRCMRCRKVWYCNAICQRNDWPLHKMECAALQRWAEAAPSDDLSVPSDAVRCLGRILWQTNLQGVDSTWSREIRAMQSHRKSIQPSAVEIHTHLAQSLVRYLGLSGPADFEEFGVKSTSDLVDVISRFITNAFALTSPSLTPLGVSVSPLVALTNHSCVPNAVAVFPRSGKTSKKEPVMHVVSLRDIGPNEEILTAYIDTTLPTPLRQAALMETYSFNCDCTLCKSPSRVDPRVAICCPKSCGGVCSMHAEENRRAACDKCYAEIADLEAVKDVAHIGQEALDKATVLQYKDYTKARQLTTNTIPILLSAGLAPSCHPLLALLKLHQSLLVTSFSLKLSQEILDESIRTAAKHFAGLSAIFDQGHPVRALALAELGKLLAVDEPSPSLQTGTFPPSGPTRLKTAYETLLRARNELLVGFGSDNDGGEVGQSVRESTVSLEKELGVWTTGIRNVLKDLPNVRETS
ncbi:hypothetical protein F5I97DRAFT_1816839 [Phlebopus sp. FC_14]|nr:hypothetical protein F5I97DRAFT_1816839 [Phlebopus sp. FC_14]